eukprot:jgi/Tetstr1/426929/TSEL_017142.t1
MLSAGRATAYAALSRGGGRGRAVPSPMPHTRSGGRRRAPVFNGEARRCRTPPAVVLAEAQTGVAPQGSKPLPGGLQFHIATTSSEFRATGYLRSHAFNSDFSEDRSEFVRRSYQRMKGDMEWNAVENKVAGTETGYEGVHVTCLIATLPCAGASGAPELETKLRAELDPTCLLPVDEQHPVPRMVVASLDINQGPRLPAEELAGTRPEQRDPGPRRAYLSNICTAAPMRRLGVAAALIEHACAVARQQGVTDCYVHVADDNPGAERLYTQVCGFVLESEETASAAARRGRPRRQLLHRTL